MFDNQVALVVAPHADDEVLGCGGAAMTLIAAGWEVDVLVLTYLDEKNRRGTMIQQHATLLEVARFVGFSDVRQLSFADVNSRSYRAQSMEMTGIPEIATAIRETIISSEPSIVFCPHIGDLHVDHRFAAEATHVACRLNWWGAEDTVRAVLAYETVGTTHRAPTVPFVANVYVDISSYLDKKLEAFAMYDGEVMASPHARSLDAVRWQAQLRGSQVGVPAAEAFSLVTSLWQPANLLDVTS